MRNHTPCTLALVAVTLAACASSQEHEKLVSVLMLEQPVGQELQTYPGGTILRIERTEDLPNAFGERDIGGGQRPKGAVELKYLGLAESGKVKLRVVSTDIETIENWRRRLGREGYATTSTDSVDFEHAPAEPFSMEGFQVWFLDAQAASLTFRIANLPPSRPGT